MLEILFLHTLYGSTFTISKILIQYAHPIFVIGLRMILAGVLLLFVAHVTKKNKIIYDRYTVLSLLQISIFGIALSYSLRYWSLNYISVTKTAFVYNLSPFISFVLAYFLLQERLSFKKAIGMLIGFSSIIPMFMFADSTETGTFLFAGVSWPEIAMLGSVTSFCYGWILVKKLRQIQDINSFALNGRTMTIGGFLSCIISSFAGESWAIAEPISFFAWLGLIIFFTNIICFSLYTYLLKHCSATLISLGSLVAPVSAALTSWLYFSEPITINMIIAGVLIIIGFAVFYFDEFGGKALP